MLLSRLHRRFTTWVALLALVLGALAPTVTQAMMAGGDRAEWLQVCGASGMVWIKADAGEVRDLSAGGQQPAGDARQHCPWCTLHGGAVAPPVVGALPALSPGHFAVPLALRSAPLAATVWASVQPRAPPLSA